MWRAFIFLIISTVLGADTTRALSIDSFEAGDQSVVAFPGTSVSGGRTTESAAGGARKIVAIGLSGPALRIEGAVLGGVYTHSEDADVVGTTQIIWDGSVTAPLRSNGLARLNLLQDGATGFKVLVRSFDNPGGAAALPTHLVVRMYDGDDPSGGTWTEAESLLSEAVTAPREMIIPFSAFDAFRPGSSEIATRVGAVSLIVRTEQPAADLVIDFFGTTGVCDRVPDGHGRVIDQCGVCGGDNSRCADCAGVPNGPRLPGTPCPSGMPGVCSEGAYSTSCRCAPLVNPSPEICDGLDNNCDGIVDDGFALLGQPCTSGAPGCSYTATYVCAANGDLRCNIDQAQLTQCELSRGCDGVPGSRLVRDECGVCGGSGTSCRDCDGIVNGPHVRDRCGVCNGDGQSCLQCQSYNQRVTLTALDQGAKRQERLLRSVYAMIQAADPSAATRTLLATKRKQVHQLQVRNWTLSWILPQQVRVCGAQLFCTQVSHQWILDEYRINSEQLRKMTVESISILRAKAAPKFSVWYPLLLSADKLHEANLAMLKRVPAQQSSCS